MKLFVAIGKKALYTYEKDGQKFNIEYIEGHDAFPYNPRNAADDINDYLEALSNEKNLGTKAKLEFDVLDSVDEYCNTAVFHVLEGENYVNRRYPINVALEEVIKKLSKDKKLLIDEYGINYDGNSYKIQNGKLVKREFDLLAYTVHCKDVIDLMNKN